LRGEPLGLALGLVCLLEYALVVVNLPLQILLEGCQSVLHVHLSYHVRGVCPRHLCAAELLLDRLGLLAERHARLQVFLRHVMMLRVIEVGDLGGKT